MGSAVNETIVRELEREAYAAVLRAVHIKNPSDYFVSRRLNARGDGARAMVRQDVP